MTAETVPTSPIAQIAQKTLPNSFSWGQWLLILLVVAAGIAGAYPKVVSGQQTFMTWIDNTMQYYAWMHRNVAAWRSLTPPLWDFSTDSGVNFSGEMQTGAFYPVNILWAWLVGSATQRALDGLVLLHLAIGWVGMTFFLRAYRLSLAAALLGGAIFALIGPVAARAHDQANIFNGLVWLPWVVAALKRALDHWPRAGWRTPWRWR